MVAWNPKRKLKRLVDDMLTIRFSFSRAFFEANFNLPVYKMFRESRVWSKKLFMAVLDKILGQVSLVEKEYIARF